MKYIFLVVFISKTIVQSTSANPLQHLTDIDWSYGENTLGRRTTQDTENPATSSDDIQSDDIETPTIKAVTTEQVKPIVSGLLTSVTNALAPLLGPLAPLSNVITPMVNTAITDLITNAINALITTANKRTLGQINGYDSYVINIPNQGSFLLLTKPQRRPTSQESIESNIVSAIGAISTNQAITDGFIDDATSPSAFPVTNTLLDNIKMVRPLSNRPLRPLGGVGGGLFHKRKPNKNQQAFLIPLNMLQAANGNLNTFSRSRSGVPLSDFQLDDY